MPLEFIQKPLAFSIQMPPGPYFLLSDFPQAPGTTTDGFYWAMPAWLPKNVFIVSAFCRREQDWSGQDSFWIDHNRTAYNTNTLENHQGGGDNSQFEMLLSVTNGAREDRVSFWPPKVLNRETDSLWFQHDNGPGWVSIHFGIMLPATDQPIATPWSLAGGGPVTPDLPIPSTGLWTWVKAEDGAFEQTSGTPTTPVTSGSIGSLKDLSGQGRHFYQPTASRRPTYQMVSGKPAARFQANAQQFLQCPTAPGGGSPRTVYLVASYPAWSNNAPVLGTEASSPHTYLALHNASPQVGAYNGGFGPHANVSPNVPHLLAVTFNGGTCTIQIDNDPPVTASTPATGLGGQLQIGGNTGNGFFGNWDVAEMVVYTAAHNFGAGDGLTVRQHLNTEHGLGLSL
jgi:hypothetical protein